jgi:predicted nucleotidyltransferase
MLGAGDEIRTKQGGVKRRVLSEVVRRVVEAAAPEKIILFGSAARGEMGPDSDLDLLVVKRGKFNRDRLIGSVYRRLQGVRAAVDVVIVTPEEVDRYRDTHCLVICPALREGKVVYGSQASASP